jgi:hypothetical protein
VFIYCVYLYLFMILFHYLFFYKNSNNKLININSKNIINWNNKHLFKKISHFRMKVIYNITIYNRPKNYNKIKIFLISMIEWYLIKILNFYQSFYCWKVITILIIVRLLCFMKSEEKSEIESKIVIHITRRENEEDEIYR